MRIKHEVLERDPLLPSSLPSSAGKKTLPSVEPIHTSTQSMKIIKQWTPKFGDKTHVYFFKVDVRNVMLCIINSPKKGVFCRVCMVPRRRSGRPQVADSYAERVI